ncbi:copper homeostasis protein cutC homolog [Eriocheir sinensis]|uniref:copper homeostasis protein cutC homolog n=1 Tax=Eriocheir sinensis TaxID=95602 RepID=UPI0021C82524|nr:copper homeostasis protein cutC homolog [Eriocheir sinensis]
MNVNLLEVCVDSVESAVAAVKGGAERIELCSALSEGGLTPTLGFLKAVQKHTSNNVKVFCMVRPRGGPMVFSEDEAEIILNDAAALRMAGADGLVFGALNMDGNLDQNLNKQFIQAAGNLPCTFHRAFDLLQHPLRELESIIELGYQRILTSGCKPTAVEGCDLLRQLTTAARGRIVILAGAGVKSSNVAELIHKTGVTECHASAKTRKVFECKNDKGVRMGANSDNVMWVTSEEEVRAIKAAMASS